MEFRVIESCRR